MSAPPSMSERPHRTEPYTRPWPEPAPPTHNPEAEPPLYLPSEETLPVQYLNRTERDASVEVPTEVRPTPVAPKGDLYHYCPMGALDKSATPGVTVGRGYGGGCASGLWLVPGLAGCLRG